MSKWSPGYSEYRRRRSGRERRRTAQERREKVRKRLKVGGGLGLGLLVAIGSMILLTDRGDVPSGAPGGVPDTSSGPRPTATGNFRRSDVLGEHVPVHPVRPTIEFYVPPTPRPEDLIATAPSNTSLDTGWEATGLPAPDRPPEFQPSILSSIQDAEFISSMKQFRVGVMSPDTQLPAGIQWVDASDGKIPIPDQLSQCTHIELCEFDIGGGMSSGEIGGSSGIRQMMGGLTVYRIDEDPTTDDTWFGDVNVSGGGGVDRYGNRINPDFVYGISGPGGSLPRGRLLPGQVFAACGNQFCVLGRIVPKGGEGGGEGEGWDSVSTYQFQYAIVDGRPNWVED